MAYSAIFESRKNKRYEVSVAWSWDFGQLCREEPFGTLTIYTFMRLKCRLMALSIQGWGVRTITFVDNGSVSFSNPVRQPLFNFKDCLDGGAKKAIRAFEALKEIYPGIHGTGYMMSVPMAGHPVLDESRVRSEFESLRRLIDQHDAIFLLMDTRESRWLPTVMGKAAGKIVMNAALGFDSFVVMRHGVKDERHPGQELGCYFCNDVVAPADVGLPTHSARSKD